MALERLSSPEQLDQMMQVTNLTGWAILLALGLVLVVVIVWGIFGRISTKVVGKGILLVPGGVKDIVSPGSGQVMGVYFDTGDDIQAGQVVARVAESDEVRTAEVVSVHSGRVLEIKVDSGTLVERGTPILSVEVVDDSLRDLEVVMYVPAAEGKKVRPGMDVQVSPSTVEREAYGFMLGKVISVGEFPATRQGMLRVLGSEVLIQALSVADAPIEIRAELMLDPQTHSGYAWTSSQGPPLQIDSGTFCTAWIKIREERPVSFVLPAFK